MADDRNDSNNDRTAVPRTVSLMARRQDNPVTIHRWVWARILYPALGFPEVIGPSVEANRINGTTSIHLLLLADVDDLRPRDVAWQLRYAPLSKPVPRYLKPNTGVENRGSNGAAPCSFPENNIEVKSTDKWAYLFLLDGRVPPPSYVDSVAPAILNSNKFSELQKQNTRLNLELIGLEQALHPSDEGEVT